MKNPQEDSVKILDEATIIAVKPIYDFQGKDIAQMYMVKDIDIFITVSLDVHKQEYNNLKLLSITDALTALYLESDIRLKANAEEKY